MRPYCSFCGKLIEEEYNDFSGKYIKKECDDENLNKVGNTVICTDCITAFKEVLDITAIEERLDNLEGNLDEIKEKV